jgi:hypothetical protein
MDKHSRSYQLWYEFLCRGEPEKWDPSILKAFGKEKMPAEEWWRKKHMNFPTTDRMEVTVIEDIIDFEPNDDFRCNVVIYLNHPKHRIIKAVKKVVIEQQKKWNLDPQDELIQVSNFPLYREVNWATIKSLETTLRVWDAYIFLQKENKAKEIQKRPDSYEIWKRAKTIDTLNYKELDLINKSSDSANSDTVRPHISKYLKCARNIIANAQRGAFPTFDENADADHLPTIDKVIAALNQIKG